jgi:unsaturated rhamnogalacturonyl hydrolase
MSKNPCSAESTLRRLADRTTNYDFTIWFWGDAIALDGLLDAAEALDDARYYEHAARFIRSWAKDSPTWVDHLTPGRALLRVSSREGGALLDRAVVLADQLVEQAPRAAGAPLYRPDIPQYRHAVWVDSIYHVPPFLAELGNVLSDPRYHELALDEWRAHTRLLGDPGRGPFLVHSYDTGQRLLHGYGWARGVGWALYGMVETLTLLPDSTPGYQEAKAEALTLAQAVVETQDSTGFWHTLIHDHEAYLESSTASFFAAALDLGVSSGLLPREYAEHADRAWEATHSRVNEAGEFWGVSACTYAGQSDVDDVTMYRTLPTEVNVWGQGSALRAAAQRCVVERVGLAS